MSGAQVTACCGTGVRDQAPGSGDPGVECVGCGRDNPTLVAMPRCIGFFSICALMCARRAFSQRMHQSLVSFASAGFSQRPSRSPIAQGFES